LERLALLRRLITPNPRSSIQFSEHVEGGAKFFRKARVAGIAMFSTPYERVAELVANPPVSGLTVKRSNGRVPS
jgi:hypothetical protein